MHGNSFNSYLYFHFVTCTLTKLRNLPNQRVHMYLQGFGFASDRVNLLNSTSLEDSARSFSSFDSSLTTFDFESSRNLSIKTFFFPVVVILFLEAAFAADRLQVAIKHQFRPLNWRPSHRPRGDDLAKNYKFTVQMST